MFYSLEYCTFCNSLNFNCIAIGLTSNTEVMVFLENKKFLALGNLPSNLMLSRMKLQKFFWEDSDFHGFLQKVFTSNSNNFPKKMGGYQELNIRYFLGSHPTLTIRVNNNVNKMTQYYGNNIRQ